MIRAKINEIFCSVQGEGLYLGQKQIFVRFAGCNLACDYCDETKAMGSGNFSWQSPEQVIKKIKLLQKKENPEAVSLTGGEPLLQAVFIEKLMPMIKKTGLKIHLETNAVLFREFKKIAKMADVIAADIKLPSAIGNSLWSEHEEFLKIAPKKTFVKIIIASNSKLNEIQKAFDLVNKVFREMPVFIQPVTEIASENGNKQVKRPNDRTICEIRSLALKQLYRFKILSQQHPIWGVK